MKVTLTSCLGNGPYQHGRYCHQDAAESRNVRQDLGTSRGLARQHPLEVYLPRNTPEHQQQPVVDVIKHLPRFDFPDPLHLHRGQRLHVLVQPRERYAHPQPDEDAEELDDVGVGHRVEPAEERVEHGDARAEDDAGPVVHVDDDAEGGPQRRQDARRPEDLAAQRRQEEQTPHAAPERVLQRVEHGHVALLPHGVREEDAAEDQAEGVPEGRLAPHQAGGVDGLGGAVDITAADPGCWNGMKMLLVEEVTGDSFGLCATTCQAEI